MRPPNTQNKYAYFDKNCAIYAETVRERNLQYWLPAKGKAMPLQAWTGPEGSRRVRLPDF
jgi:hypothetical protein